MVSQIVSVASYFVCWIVASRFGSLVAPTIPLEAPWDQVVAIAVVFLITLIAIRFAYTALEKLIKDWHLQKLNKVLGGLLGFTKGLLLCLIITFFAVMLSETSRAVVFNSKTGSHLVQLITRIGLFVPKDSYEFVHTQFAQFHSKVGEAVPGQTPAIIPVQNAETVQQMLAQLQQGAKEKMEPSTGSLLTALSQWWKGSKDDLSDTEPLAQTPLTPQTNRAATYTPPTLLPAIQPVNTFSGDSQTTALQSATSRSAAVEEFFTRQTVTSVPTQVQQATTQLLTMPPSVPEISSPPPSSLSPLTTLAPLTESLSTLPESNTSLMPLLPTPPHVGSDLLLRNSGRTTNSNSTARVFQGQ